MIGSRVVTVGGRDYQLRHLPAGQARKLLVRLFKLIGPAMAALAGGEGGLAGVAGLKGATLDQAVRLLADNLTEEGFEHVCRELLFSGACDYRVPEKGFALLDEGQADLIFAGKIDELLKLVGEALVFNYRSFFGGLATAVSAPPTPTA